MKIVKDHPTYGQIVYSENALTGKKSITVNGVTAIALSKKIFMAGDIRITLSGNTLTGMQLSLGADVIELSPKPRWYEILLAILPFAFLMVWGNSPALCEIFPVIGGAIGGGLAGALGVASLSAMKSAKSFAMKILIGAVMFAAIILIANTLAVAILSAGA